MKLAVVILGLHLAMPLFSQTPAVDLIVVNANIYTMNARVPRIDAPTGGRASGLPDKSRSTRAEALAVSGNRITAVGTNDAIRKLANEKTRVIDAKGKTVLPGFNDAHVHFMAIGNSFSSMDLRSVRTPDELLQRIAHYARYLPKGRWILGGQWNNANWTPNTLPDKKLIDAVTPDNPVMLYNSDASAVLVNSLALRRAGVDKRTRDVPGGTIDRDADGEPTGILRGKAIEYVRPFIPADHVRRLSEIAETATNYAGSLGITSVHDTHSDDSSAVYRELERQGKLKTRVYDCISLSDWKKLQAADRPANTEMVHTGCLKGFSDGEETSDLLPNILAADKSGFQIAIHAMGPRANEIVLSAFEAAIKTNGKRDRRFRVEHAHNPKTEHVSRFGRSDLIASVQPWLFNGASSTYYAELQKTGARLALGSDAPMTDFSPLLGIHAAANASDPSGRLSVYDAVRAYTVGSAFAEFQENEKGTIETGKLADFIILSDDVFTIDPVKIRDTFVLTTVVNGVIVYDRNGN